MNTIRSLFELIKRAALPLVLSLVLVPTVRAVDVIPFIDKRGATFRLVPFHIVGKERVVAGLFDLFRDQHIYEYFNDGSPKTMPDCEMHFFMGSGLAIGFLPVKSMAILDSGGQFVGYVGAHAYFDIGTTSADILFIDVYCAIKPELQRRGIIKNALLEYCSYVLKKMPSDRPKLRGTTFFIKTYVHPRNVAALGLARSFDSSAVTSHAFVPDYCWGLPERYRQRVQILISMETILKQVQNR